MRSTSKPACCSNHFQILLEPQEWTLSPAAQTWKYDSGASDWVLPVMARQAAP